MLLAKKEIRWRDAVEGLAFCIVGMVATLLSVYAGEFGLLLVLVGGSMAVFGIIDVANTFGLIEVKRKKGLFRDKKALAYIWAVAACAIGFTPFVYYLVGSPFDALVTYIDANYTFTGVTASAYVFVRVLISYLMAFVIFAVVIWVMVNAKAEPYGGT